ncbi:MAG: hypothetical protein M5U08_09155 [Burkholderiales bacterium]|nr:hypothetical protein [Burkholderiales bacterium]
MPPPRRPEPELDIAHRPPRLESAADRFARIRVLEQIELWHRPTDGLLARHARQRAPGRIHLDQRLIVHPAERHRLRAGVKQVREELLRVAQRLLRTQLRGDVAPDAAIAHERAGLVEHGLAAQARVAHATVGQRAPHVQVAERAPCLEVGAVRIPGAVQRLKSL